MRIAVQYDDAAVLAALGRLRAAAADMEPAMAEVAETLRDSVEESFAREAAPDGSPWAPLSESTRARRARRGHWPGAILNIRGDRGLAGSVSTAHDESSAAAGTNLVYAPVHQFGAAEGEFGSDSRGRPLPYGDIPARPFLGVSDEAREEIVDALARHLAAAAAG